MTLAELKSKMDAAKKALDAKPEDEALKAAYEAAKSAYEAKKAEEDEDQDEDEDDDDSSGKGGKGKKKDDDDSDEDDDEPEVTDEKTKAYIKKLRAENAKRRKEGKAVSDELAKIKKGLKSIFGEEEDEEPAEKKLEKLQGQTGALTFRAAILESAVEHGIGKDGLEYFEFLVSKAVEKLGDDEELSEEELGKIAAKVKGAGGSGGGKGNSTSVGGKGGGNPKPGSGGTMTLDEFCGLSFSQKQELFAKNETLYNALFKEAVAKGRL